MFWDPQELEELRDGQQGRMAKQPFLQLPIPDTSWPDGTLVKENVTDQEEWICIIDP